MIMTMHDKTAYDNSTLCHFCNEELGKDRVRDHCHLSGKFRGAAHEVCNLKFKIVKFFPVVFHNYLLKNWEIAKEILLVFQIMQKSTFLSRNRLSLTNL